MKSGRLLLALLLIPALAMMGCEGDAGPQGPAGPAGAQGEQGPAGPAGEDGADATLQCLDCHGTPTFVLVESQYRRSQHGLGEFVAYAGGRRDCARCHSGEGFVEFIDSDGVYDDFGSPVPLNCQHCHQVHKTFTGDDLNPAMSFNLRSVGPVDFIYDKGNVPVDFGSNANMCANCHQSRRAEPEVDKPGEATYTITSTHYGPHHGAQANTLSGRGYANDIGAGLTGARTIPSSNRHLTAGADCVVCHMGPTDAEEFDGGHTWKPSLASCNDALCHGGDMIINPVAGGPRFVSPGNTLATVAVLIDDIEALLLQLEVLEEIDDPDNPGATIIEPIAPKTHEKVLARAFFNWIALKEDRSFGAHNPSLVENLLFNTKLALTDYIANNPPPGK
jgi:hypothetical protein